MSSSMEGTSIEPADVVQEAPEETSRARIWFKRVSWGVFAIFCLLFFTLLKLPEDRIKSLIRGNITSALASQGIGFASGQEILSIGFGVSYVLKDVTLTLPPSGDTVHIDEVMIGPSILSALTGKLGGNFRVKQGAGSLVGSVGMRGSRVDADIEAKNFEIQRLGLLPALVGIQANAGISGTAAFHGDPNVPTGWDGSIHADLKNVGLEPQTFMGFSIPRIADSQGKLDLIIDKSRMTFKTAQLGKPGSSDDLIAHVTGDIALARQWNSSQVNLRANFTLSPAVLKSFSLLDAILASGKQPDGSYAFQFTGPTQAVIPTPIAPGTH